MYCIGCHVLYMISIFAFVYIYIERGNKILHRWRSIVHPSEFVFQKSRAIPRANPVPHERPWSILFFSTMFFHCDNFKHTSEITLKSSEITVRGRKSDLSVTEIIIHHVMNTFKYIFRVLLFAIMAICMPIISVKWEPNPPGVKLLLLVIGALNHKTFGRIIHEVATCKCNLVILRTLITILHFTKICNLGNQINFSWGKIYAIYIDILVYWAALPTLRRQFITVNFPKYSIHLTA